MAPDETLGTAAGDLAGDLDFGQGAGPGSVLGDDAGAAVDLPAAHGLAGPEIGGSGLGDLVDAGFDVLLPDLVGDVLGEAAGTLGGWLGDDGAGVDLGVDDGIDDGLGTALGDAVDLG